MHPVDIPPAETTALPLISLAAALPPRFSPTGVITPDQRVVTPGAGTSSLALTPSGKNDPAHDAFHSFSRPLAREIGIPGAILLRFLSFKVGRSNNCQDGKKWFYATIEELAARFPYLGPAGIAKLGRRLEERGLLNRGNYNRWRRDRTTWYSVERAVRERVEKGLIGFFIQDATAYDLNTAVLITHLLYRAGQGEDGSAGDAGAPGMAFSATGTAEYLPISKATLERKLLLLADRVLIDIHRDDRKRSPRVSLRAALASRVRPVAKQPQKPAASGPGTGGSRSTPPEPASESGRPEAYCEDATRLLITTNIAYLTPLEADARLRLIQGTVNDEAKALLDSMDPGNLLTTRSPDSLLSLARTALGKLDLYANEGTRNLTCELVVLCAIGNTHPLAYRGSFAFASDLDCSDRSNPCRSALVRLRERYNSIIELEKEDVARMKSREHARRHASPDAYREERADLAPMQKSRVLLSGMRAANRIGVLHGHVHVFPTIRWNPTSLVAAERFFETNGAWAASDLLSVLISCSSRQLNPVPEGWDPDWHLRRGVELRFCLTHLERIVQDLGQETDRPPIEPVDRAVLFPPKAKASA